MTPSPNNGGVHYYKDQPVNFRNIANRQTHPTHFPNPAYRSPNLAARTNFDHDRSIGSLRLIPEAFRNHVGTVLGGIPQPIHSFSPNTEFGTPTPRRNTIGGFPPVPSLLAYTANESPIQNRGSLNISPDTRSKDLRDLGKYTSQLDSSNLVMSSAIKLQSTWDAAGYSNLPVQPNTSTYGYPQQTQGLNNNILHKFDGPATKIGSQTNQPVSPTPKQEPRPLQRLIPSTGSSLGYSSGIQNSSTMTNPNSNSNFVNFSNQGTASFHLQSKTQTTRPEDQVDPVTSSPKQSTPHHGKSLRSIQLFEHEESHAYPKIGHPSKNPLVRAFSLEIMDSIDMIPLAIHEDSCYNYLNKRGYRENEMDVTPLEEFFHKESVSQFKVASYLAENHAMPSSINKKVNFKRTKKNILVLDIDETLVHSELIVEQSMSKPEFAGKKHDRYIEFPNKNGTVDVYGVRFRPYLMEFIERMSKKYDLAVYTASAQDYADAILDQLDPAKTKFVGRLYREHCVPVNNMNIKNMSMFSSHDAILVDNLIYSYAFHMNQGVPICPFVDDMMDVELKDLATILEHIDYYDSPRHLLQDLLGLDEFYKYLEDECEDPMIELSPTVLQQYTMNTQQHSKTAQGNTVLMYKL